MKEQAKQIFRFIVVGTGRPHIYTLTQATDKKTALRMIDDFTNERGLRLLWISEEGEFKELLKVPTSPNKQSRQISEQQGV
jgi:hypothetical protein